MKKAFIILFTTVILTGCTNSQAEFEHQIELEDYLSDHAAEYVHRNCEIGDVYYEDEAVEYVVEHYTNAVFEYLYDHFEDELLGFIRDNYSPEDVFPESEEQ